MTNKNVLLILVDEWRASTGYESKELNDWVDGPDGLVGMKAIRANAIDYKQHYIMSSACAPSRASIFTAQYPSLHGVSGVDGGAKSAVADMDPNADGSAGMFWLTPFTLPTIGNMMQLAGYETRYFGKWHISHLSDIFIPGTHDAIPSYTATGEPIVAVVDMYTNQNTLRDYGFSGYVGPVPHGALAGNTGESNADGTYYPGRDPFYAEQVINFLQNPPTGKNWFTVVSFVNPHDIALYGLATRLLSQFDITVDPTLPLEPMDLALFDQTLNDNLNRKPTCQTTYRDIYNEWFPSQGNFREALRQYQLFYYTLQKKVDTHIADVYAKVPAGTVVIVTSDHGELLGSHGRLQQKWYTAYQEVVHVPLMIVPSAHEGNPEQCDVLTSHTDLMRTVCSFADLLSTESKFNDNYNTFVGTYSQVRADSKALGRIICPKPVDDDVLLFVTDDDVTRGSRTSSPMGLPTRNVVGQPNHILTVITRHTDGKIYKFSIYWDPMQFWSNTNSSPITDDWVRAFREGTTHCSCTRQIKRTPTCVEREMYCLDDDKMELVNLALRPSELMTELEELLRFQCETKLTFPTPHTPGQVNFPDVELGCTQHPCGNTLFWAGVFAQFAATSVLHRAHKRPRRC